VAVVSTNAEELLAMARKAGVSDAHAGRLVEKNGFHDTLDELQRMADQRVAAREAAEKLAVAALAAPVVEAAAPSAEPAVERNKKLGIHKPVRGQKLIYPFFPVPLVPGKGARGEERKLIEAQITALLAALPHPALLVYLAGCRTRDSRFTFSMSANQARAARGVKTKADKGDEFLKLLVDAGLVAQVLSGGTFGGAKVASTFRILPWSPEMQTKAMAAFADYRAQRRANDPSRGHAKV
jgi:hypothetical protein